MRFVCKYIPYMEYYNIYLFIYLLIYLLELLWFLDLSLGGVDLAKRVNIPSLTMDGYLFTFLTSLML